MAKQKSQAQRWRKPSRSRVVIAVTIMMSLLVVGGVFAQWAGLWSNKRAPDSQSEVAPASLTPSSPAKEYIYAGGKLVATEEPLSGGCSFSLTPSSQSFAASGGTSSVSVTTTAGCSWTAVSNSGFITITSGSSGSGSGTVNYSVAANTGAARNGTMTIAGLTFTVSQSAAGCSFSISPSSQNFVASGGSSSVTVTAGAGCGWTAVSNNAFITITSGTSGSGNGTVNYSVAANTGAARSGTMTIAGQTFTVTQDAGSSCTYSISPTSQNFTSGGGSGNVSVTTSAGCAWTAVSNDAWITITAGATGSGNGTVSYSIAANSGAARSGTMTIAGQNFMVTQDASGGGTPCTSMTLTPSSPSIPSSAGNYSFTISSALPANCTRTATSNVSWLTITGGATGTGNGTVTYSVTQNTTGVLRSGTVTMTSGKRHVAKQSP